MTFTLEAKRFRREYEKRLAEAALATGKQSEWSAGDEVNMGLIMTAVDRNVELKAIGDATKDPKVKVRVSTEIRLNDRHIHLLVKALDSRRAHLVPQTRASARAQRAANQRWHPPRVVSE
jgi:hypothetical protein